MRPKMSACLSASRSIRLILLSTIAALMLAFGLSACGGSAASSEAANSSAAADDAANISVTINVDSSDADGSASGSETVSLPTGANVLDAMEVSGFDVVVQDSEWGAYIDAINGLKSGDFGGMSGWVYTLNSEMVTVSSDECILSDGDVIDWNYVTDMS